MEVILSKCLGFCYGVRRTIEIAEEHADGKSFTLGSIIHNPQMVEKLRNKGINSVESLSTMDGGTLIIRSHGVGQRVYKEAERRGIKIIDATCPHVKRAQSAAQELLKEGRQVIIVGEKNHPEVKGILGWLNDEIIVLEAETDARTFVPKSRVGVISQTTLSDSVFTRIVSHLIEKSKDIRILKTICNATIQRQVAALELAKQVDIMLVIGGRNSANTARLAQLCGEKCRTYHIETAQELLPVWFEKITKIGITAGASTPDWIIEEVFKECQKI